MGLDGDRLRGKWQTLCIDLDKILGTKLPKDTTFQIMKLSLTAEDSQLLDTNVIFSALNTSGGPTKI